MGNATQGTAPGELLQESSSRLLLRVSSKTGTDLIYAGADTDGNGNLRVGSKTGTDLIYAGGAPDETGFFIEGRNKTGESVVQLHADEYGNGIVYAGNRKGEGRTLKPGP